MSPSPLEPWVFRDGRRTEAGRALLDAVVSAALGADEATGERRRRLAVDAVVRAGELEAALADARASAVDEASRVTDTLAELALGHSRHGPLAAPLARLERASVPERLVVSPPEGFSYYALAPEAYARAAMQVAEARRAAGVLVVGVRSIGTTLSAMASAGLRARGVEVGRITVRPEGPPDDRHLDLADDPACARAAAARSEVLIVDEGPGASGSTFLAVAEALARAGVPSERITLVFSHDADVGALTARDAEARLRPFARHVADAEMRAPPRSADLSGGAWRARRYASEAEWPAVWTQCERRKLLSPDGARLFKFEGLGRVGAEVRTRARRLATHGLVAQEEGDGWVSFPWLASHFPLTASDLDADMLGQLARACAERPEVCGTRRPCADLAPVVAKNLEVVLGARARSHDAAVDALRVGGVVRPAVVDGRMAPHEWLRREVGRPALKVDGVDHGDDHLFPGPTDVAWDLAGAIVEWRMDEAAERELLARYRAASGDDASPRIHAWVVAYASMRAAVVTLAARGTGDAAERARLARALEVYRATCGAALARHFT